MYLTRDATLEWLAGLQLQRAEYLARLEREVLADGGKLVRTCQRLGLSHRTVLSWMARSEDVRQAVERARATALEVRSELRAKCVECAPAKRRTRTR